MSASKHSIVAALCAAAFLATAATASNAATTAFQDAPGDSGAAPDLTTIDVSHTAAADVTFQIGIGNRGASLNPDEYVFVFLDTDANASVGPGPMGSEYILVFGALRFVRLGRIIDGSAVDFATPQTTLLVALTPGLNATINRRELGDTQRFNFGVAALGESYDDVDGAPERGMFSYSLAPPTIQSVAPSWTPARPRAGKRFALAGVELGLSTGEKALATSVRCQAKIAGKPVRATGNCRWLLPASAKGKRLAVTVTATYESTAKTTSYAFRVG